jgi:tetratricopeptide (TPR) repeat protein
VNKSYLPRALRHRGAAHALLGGLLLAASSPTRAAAPDAVLATPPPPFRAPYLPSSDTEVLQQVPADSDPNVRAMKTLRVALERAPDSLPAADKLARAYIDFGREIGDAHYAGYAEAVLAPWLARPQPPPVAALIDEAVILQFRHQFTEAREQLKQALAQDSSNAQAWLTLATIDMVQGDYPSAAHDCSHVGGRGGIELSVACIGNLRSYLGQAQQSLVLLTQIAGNRSAAAATFNSWVQGMLAETCERLGDWPQAEDHYRRALALTPKDNYLQVGYADFLLDRNRPQEVLELLRDSGQSDTAFLRLALAQAALHSPDLPQYTWIMRARFEALAQRGSDYFGREQVRFALYLQHDPQTALDLAQRNWQVQRAPWDIRVLLEAALAANKPQAAKDVIAFVHETKLQDPTIAALVQQLDALPPHSAGAPR